MRIYVSYVRCHSTLPVYTYTLIGPTLFVIGVNGTKQSVTLEELAGRLNWASKPVAVPNRVRRCCSAAGSRAGVNSVDLGPLMERQRALEDALATERNSTTALHQEMHKLKELSAKQAAPAAAVASSSAEVNDEVEVVEASPAGRGKRKAVSTTPATAPLRKRK